MDNLNYLLAAFIVIWVVLFAYILVMSQRQRRLQRDINLLKTSLQEQQKK